MQKKYLNLIRFTILKCCFDTKEGHVGSAFSIVEILYVIFKKYIKSNFFYFKQRSCINRCLCNYVSFKIYI